MVDRDHARLQLVGQQRGALHRTGEGKGRQTEWQTVGLGDHFFEGVEGDDRGNRRERFLAHDPGVFRDFGQHGGRVVEAGTLTALPTQSKLRADGQGVIDVFLGCRHATRVGQWAELGAGVVTVAKLEVGADAAEGLDEALVDAGLHIEAGGRRADLPAVAELEVGPQGGDRLDIDVVADDERRMPAQLQGAALQVLPGQGTEGAADRHGTGKGHLADDLRADQLIGHFSRHAEHQVEHARRHAGILEGAAQLDARGRGFFRALGDDRATGGQGPGNLAHQLADREVPRAERRDRADRLAQHQLAHAGGTRRDHPAIGTTAFFGVPVDVITGPEGFHARLGQRLALFEGDQGGNFVGAVTHQVGSAAQHFGALVGRRLAPHLKTTRGSRQRAIQIGGTRQAQVGDDLAGGRVEHIGAAWVIAGRPLPVDQKGFYDSHGWHFLHIVSSVETLFFCTTQS
ncbi:hypothetical protein D3C73_911260 [compost metagenome]